ncbi:MAG TPA: putative toxin-antitoxin system toxin component, PIN family [Methanosarcinales archaeon]|nr:putative toxin-antitoxin system toxin component, PIN family [Methanosarcinales archaeon]
MQDLVVDTHIVFKALAGRVEKYKLFLETIKEKCDRIVITNDIKKEYRSRASTYGMTLVIIMQRLEKLGYRGKKKIRKVSASIEIKKYNFKVLKDEKDLKFIEAAIASKASYLVTEDSHLLELKVIKHKSGECKIIKPEDYL